MNQCKTKIAKLSETTRKRAKDMVLRAMTMALKMGEKKLKSCQTRKGDLKGDLQGEKCKQLAENIKRIKTMIAKVKKPWPANLRKALERNLQRTLCNHGCKGTLLEDGPGDVLPASLAKKYKKIDFILNTMTATRKNAFGKKTSVLKDNFYEKLKKSDVETMKKQGAISGCMWNMPKEYLK